MQRIKNYLEELGVECTSSTLDKFRVYYEELIEWNTKLNLTAIVDYDDVVIKHFIDSISSIKHIPYNSTILDIGSGAGFPAIPIKIVRPDVEVLMIDSLNKKVNFLDTIISKLELSNTYAKHSRAEDVGAIISDNLYDIVVARAVAKLNTLLEYCVPYLKIGGKFIAYKTTDYDEELDKASHALTSLNAEIDTIDSFQLKDTDIKRVLIVIKKIGKTPIIYPRNKNLPRKNPL